MVKTKNFNRRKGGLEKMEYSIFTEIGTLNIETEDLKILDFGTSGKFLWYLRTSTHQWMPLHPMNGIQKIEVVLEKLENLSREEL